VNRGPRQHGQAAYRRGFTLLEVLLALGLSVLLLAAMGLAIEFHLRLLDTGRAEVEQAQLARAILRRIADDLRNALQYTPSAPSSSATSSSSSSSAAASSTSTTDSSPTSESSDESMLEDSQTADRTSNLANATSLPALPGIYGNDHELQIDVSRLPRLDQMQTLLSSEAASGSMSGTSSAASGGMSDLRTVLYYAESSGSAALGPAVSASGSGLQRRDMDRTTAALAVQQGESLQTQGKEEPMAPEVQEIQFRYFDGTEWVDTWDTTDRSGLPLAVQIGIWLAYPQNSRRRAAAAAGEMSEDRRMYQLMVHLPAARATTSASASGTDSTSSNASTNSSSTGSSSSGTTSGSTSSGSSSGGSR
jgi:prepilin-type N-terminal cleavage/methylation domain-containing protein